LNTKQTKGRIGHARAVVKEITGRLFGNKRLGLRDDRDG
jgi:hypothetical protein